MNRCDETVNANNESVTVLTGTALAVGSTEVLGDVGCGSVMLYLVIWLVHGLDENIGRWVDVRPDDLLDEVDGGK